MGLLSKNMEQEAIQSIIKSTIGEIGESFFCTLVENLAKTLDTYGAWVTEYYPESRRLKALAFWLDGKFIRNFEYDITGTPCETTIDRAELVHIHDSVLELYPNSNLTRQHRTVSYIGVPLLDHNKNILGHIAVLDKQPLPEDPGILAIFKLFAVRASAELQRVKIESALKEKNQCLESMVAELQEAKEKLTQSESRFRSVAQSANDAIITSDESGMITFWNRHAEVMFGYAKKEALGKSLSIIVPERYRQAHNQGFSRFMHTGQPKIIGKVVELQGIRKNGQEFPLELTLSSWQTDSGRYITGIIRDITRRKQEQEKLEAAHSRLAIEDKRKSAELEKARQLQLAMLPATIPEIQNLDVQVTMETAIEVGGDYYDIIRGENNEWTFILGDASGHGLEPGMIVATVKSLIATLIHTCDLKKLFSDANRIFKSLNLGRLFMALEIFRFKGNKVEICAGGMPPALIYRQHSDSIEEIEIAAPPLGGIADFDYQLTEITVQTGDVLLLQTDGFIERMNHAGDMFGYERTCRLFKSLAGQSAGYILKNMTEQGLQWAGGCEQEDDITMMVIKVK